MIGIRFSTSFRAKQKRIKRLPVLFDNFADTIRKRDALKLVKNFDKGISNGTFELKDLKSQTIKRKESQGYPKPSTPLYGKGKEKNSYHKMLRIRKLKNGYKVFVSKAFHHSKKVKLALLFEVHENGAIIKVGKTLIRIPPRPAFLKAFNEILSDIKKRENTKLVKDTISNFMRDGNAAHFDRVQSKLTAGLIKAGVLV